MEMERIKKFIMELPNSKLYELQKFIEREIYLSEECIKEGSEVRE